MKTNSTPIMCPAVELKEKKALQLIAAGGSIEKIGRRTLRQRIASLRLWLSKNWEHSEFIHQQVQARKEEILLQQLKHGLPPRIF